MMMTSEENVHSGSVDIKQDSRYVIVSCSLTGTSLPHAVEGLLNCTRGLQMYPLAGKSARPLLNRSSSAVSSLASTLLDMHWAYAGRPVTDRIYHAPPRSRLEQSTCPPNSVIGPAGFLLSDSAADFREFPPHSLHSRVRKIPPPLVSFSFFFLLLFLSLLSIYRTLHIPYHSHT